MIKQLIDTQALANRLLNDFGLTEQGWRFQFNTNAHRVGVCKHSTKTIEYSKHFLTKTPSGEIEDTLRHEIAHALVGPGYGHGPEWQVMAIKCGAEPTRCTTLSKSTKQHNYIIKCSSCGGLLAKRHRVKRHILNNHYHTSRCCNAPLEAYKVNLKENPNKVERLND